MIRRFMNLFTSKDAKKIFSHEANGELCAYCGKPMHTKQGVIQVRRAEKCIANAGLITSTAGCRRYRKKYHSHEGKPDER
nr:MAG TPA: C2H2 type zinc-finger protein [Caudoviricetes sp.]